MPDQKRQVMDESEVNQAVILSVHLMTNGELKGQGGIIKRAEGNDVKRLNDRLPKVWLGKLKSRG